MTYPFQMPDTLSTDSALLCVPINLVPYFRTFFKQMQRRESWHSDIDYQLGYQAFVKMEAELTQACISDILDALHALRGLKPNQIADGINPLPENSYYTIGDLISALHVAQGVLSSGWFGTNPVYATLADVVTALQGKQKSTGEGLWDTIQQLLGAGSSAASIMQFIESTLADAEVGVVNGGLLTTLVAITAANAGLQQQLLLQQSTQQDNITKILQALRGGTAPSDNILQALRGVVPSDDERNVVERLS